MGVDLSITRAVGVILDMDAFKQWQDAIDPDGEYYGDEYLYEAFHDHQREGIDFDTAGSYYTASDENVHFLSIRRLTESWDVYGMPGGILEGPTNPNLGEAPTVEEAARITYIAETMGTKYPQIKTFTAVLWH